MIKYVLYCFIRVNGEDCCYEVFKKIVEKNKLLKVNEIWIEMVGIELDWDGNLKFFVLDKKNLVFIDEVGKLVKFMWISFFLRVLI